MDNKININAIQQFISIGEDTDFIKKYDKDNNSIFTKEEINQLCEDIFKFAAKDGKIDELSDEEALNFYNSTMSKSIDKFEQGKNPVTNWLNNVNKAYELNNKLKTEFGRDFKSDIEIFLDLDDEKIQTLKKLLTIDKNKKLNPLSLSLLIDCNEEELAKIEKLMNIKGLEDVSSLGFMLNKMRKLDDEQLTQVPLLLNIPNRNGSLTSREIAIAAQLPKEDIEALIKNNPNFTIQQRNSTRIEISGENSNYNFSRIYDTENKEWIETVTTENDGSTTTKTLKNTKLGITHITKSDSVTGIWLGETIYKYDKKGNLISTEEHVKGSDGLNQNISITDKNGKKHPVQWTSLDKQTGIRTTQKDLVSPDGTRTNYYLEESPDGLNISEYKITDRNGNILLDEKRTFQPVNGNPDKFISSINDKVYEITYSQNAVTIFDKSKNRTVQLDLNKIIENNNPEILNIIKQLPGDKLIKIAERKLEKIAPEDAFPSWSAENRTLNTVTSEYSDDKYEIFGIFAHEFGHFLDTEIHSEKFGIISQNPEFLAIYNEELENFKKASTTFQQEALDYFIDNEGDMITSTAETVAEAHATLISKYTIRRTYNLQKNFPKTIAKIAQLLNQ